MDEAGASVYSTSKEAQEVTQLPSDNTTGISELRSLGSISIARRLQDPLAELVKIDPKVNTVS